MSLLRALTRNIARKPVFPKGIIPPCVPEGPGVEAFTAWVSTLSERYGVPRETILCAVVEMSGIPVEQKIELQEALKAIRDGNTQQLEEG